MAVRPDFRRIAVPGAICALLIAVGAAPGPLLQQGDNIDASLLRAASISSDSLFVWVYLKDRGLDRNELRRAIREERSKISPRALERRRLRGRFSGIVPSDLPVSSSYTELLRRSGLRVRWASRWLNAVSGVVAPGDLSALAVHQFVDRIAPLGRGKRIRPVVEPLLVESFPERGIAAGLFKETQYDSLFYGFSWQQNLSLQVPLLHEQGLSGEGIIVGIMDTGFKFGHVALRDSLVLDSYDFVNDDSLVSDELGEDSHDHGTRVWGVVAGCWPGTLMGPAYNASLLLAKTEDKRSETPVEEDYWIAAIEWMEERGVDVANTSLGYYDWYSYRNMDGETAPITIAADEAAARGVVIVTSAGNEGNLSKPGDDDIPVQYYIGAPADGDSVIAVGATYSDGTRASFSSHGPTFDGRIKPDVMARGVDVATVSTAGGDSTLDLGADGTSFSSPLVAGVAALIVEAHPDWNPIEVREALQATADRSRNLYPGEPDNDYGWGYVQGADAEAYGELPPPPPESLLFFNFPNPFSTETTFSCSLPSAGELQIHIFTLSGTLVRTLAGIADSASQVLVSWDGKNEAGRSVAPAAYLAVLEFEGRRVQTKILKVRLERFLQDF